MPKLPLFCLLPLLLLSFASAASDTAREKRIAEQIVDTIFDGEPMELEAKGQSFLAIHMESTTERKDRAVIILHGRGFHPEWETVVKPLRTTLPEQGWTTLALQMPVMAKEAKYNDYVPIFPEAHPRIDAAITWLRSRGVKHIVLIAHSCGAHMAMSWVRQGGKGIDGYVGIGMGATDYQQPMKEPFPLDRMKVPLLDLYGSKDYPAVLAMAPERLTLIRKGGHKLSKQQMLPDADHYHVGKNEQLIEAVSQWLNTVAP